MSGGDPGSRRREDKCVAVFESRALAETARDALLGAGIPADAIQLIAAHSGEPAPAGTPLGHVMVAVDPASEWERKTIIEVLQGCGPVDLATDDRLGP